MNILTIGAGLYFIAGSKKSTTQSLTIPSSGIIYKCDYIEVLDKDKFQKFLKDHAVSYLIKIQYNLNSINYRIYLLELIEKLNKTCYSKIIDGKELSKNELIALLLISGEAYSALTRAFFKKDIFTQQELESPEHKDYRLIIDSSRTSFLKSLNTMGLVDSDVEPFEELFELNGSKFPK